MCLNVFECVLNVFSALFADELLKHEQEQARLNEARKISVVNVNPTNIRPHSDTPEIRKYKKRFNSEILCAALWGETTHFDYSRFNHVWSGSRNQTCVFVCAGVNLLVGTENGLMLLDRSGQGKVYNLINRRRFQQMDVLEGLNVLVTISGWFSSSEVTEDELLFLSVHQRRRRLGWTLQFASVDLSSLLLLLFGRTVSCLPWLLLSLWCSSTPRCFGLWIENKTRRWGWQEMFLFLSLETFRASPPPETKALTGDIWVCGMLRWRHTALKK